MRTEKPYGFVYLIRCLANGKVYVGCTTQTVETRWRLHCAASKKPKYVIARAIAEFGPDAFEVISLAATHSREEMLVVEYRNILHYQATNPAVGFNQHAQEPYPRFGALGPCNSVMRGKAARSKGVRYEQAS
jgi:predicted GIY-YIG superfamily endonuclease